LFDLLNACFEALFELIQAVGQHRVQVGSGSASGHGRGSENGSGRGRHPPGIRIGHIDVVIHSYWYTC
jgi:hypothetical protein